MDHRLPICLYTTSIFMLKKDRTPDHRQPLPSSLARSLLKKSCKTPALILLGALFLQGCQSFPGSSLLSRGPSEAETLAIWNQLDSGQKLASARYHDDLNGLSALLQPTPVADWRHWQDPVLPDYDLWDRLRASFALEVSSDDPRVQAEINWYRRNPGYMDRVIQRASRYMFHVVEEIERRGLPGELALLPIVESAYDPFAYSHARASGMWQFMPGTARHLGLDNNWWYDGRRDVIASTDAALTYLNQQYQRFGDWHLALAAYNSGGGNVNRALRNNRAAGGNGTFWELNLPAETRAYVPKMVALARLMADPEAHGINLPSIPNRPYFAAVDTRGQIDLALAARLADISINELYLLNPGFSQWATSPEGPHRLLIPIEQAEVITAELDQLPARQRMSWQRYRVQSGDSLLTISRRFSTTPSMIRDANQLRGDIIRAGHELLIPIPSQEARQYTLSEDQRIERRQNVTRSGQRVDHVVRSGDSFWLLARRHNVSVRELAAWNNMAPRDPLMPGQRLVIWSKSSTASSNNVASNDSRSVIRRVNYTVRNGDNLAAIASRFRVSVNDIARWNNINPSRYLQPGQNLTLHVDVTRN